MMNRANLITVFYQSQAKVIWQVTLFLILFVKSFSGLASCEDALGKCGRDEERPCVDNALTVSLSCCGAAKLTDSRLNCAIPRKLGERCSTFFPCGSGLSCEIQPWEPALRCAQTNVPDTTEPLGVQLCENLYSKDVHHLAKSGYGSVMTFGGGAQIEVGGTNGVVEVGTAYAKDGRFGCYSTFCKGMSVGTGQGATAGIFASLGQYDEFNLITPITLQPGHDFLGEPSFVLVDTIELQYKVVELSVSLGAVFADSNGALGLALGNTYSIGIGATSEVDSPVGVSVAALGCYTQAVQVRDIHVPPGAQNQEAEQYLKTAATIAGTGVPTSPFNDFGIAFESIVLAEPPVSQGDRRLLIEGDITLSENIIKQAGATRPSPITLSSVGKSCSSNSSLQCSFNSDCPNYGNCSVSNNICSQSNPCDASEKCLPALSCANGSSCSNHSDCLDGSRCDHARDMCRGTTLTASVKSCFSGSAQCNVDADCPNYGRCVDSSGEEYDSCSNDNPCATGQTCEQAFNDASQPMFGGGNYTTSCPNGTYCNNPKDFCEGQKIGFKF